MSYQHPPPPPQQPWQPGPPVPPGPVGPYGPQGPWGPPPRRGGGGGLLAALLIGGVCLLIFCGLGGYAVWRTTDGADWRSDGPELPSFTPAPAPTPYTPPPPPSPAPEPAKPRKGDDDGVITRASILKRSVLYEVPPLRDAGCAPQSQVPLDSAANLETYYRAALRCLDRAWQQTDAEGVIYRPAKLRIHNGENVSACGPAQHSFYCTSEDTIYMYVNEIVQPWLDYPGDAVAQRNIRLAAAHTIAHEYGHHMQNLVKMFLVIGDFSGTLDEDRLELQANCLGGAFLGSQRGAYPITSTDFANQQYWRYTRLPHHGTEAHQASWGDRGYADADPGACNTWTAPRGDVN